MPTGKYQPQPSTAANAGNPSTGPTSAPRTGRLWVGYADAAQHLGVNVSTLRVWVYRAMVPHHRLAPRTVRFDLNELDAWLDRRLRGADQTSSTPSPEAA